MKRLFCSLLTITIPLVGSAAENLPSKPFAQMVYLPDCGQWTITPWYQYTEFQKIWRGSHQEHVTVGDEHGFDQNDGMFLTEYSFKQDWAVDLLLGYTSLATRSFTPDGQVQKTDGLMDVTFGLRWQVFNETNSSSPFTPTLTLRAGGIVSGTYDDNFPFAPGNGSLGIEPSVLLAKSFGWPGLGMYGSLGYRVMRSGGKDQVFGTIGLSQRYKGFNFNAGARYQQNTSGDDIPGPSNTLVYSVNVKEVNEMFEAGVGYTDKGGRHYQFYLDKNFDGRNTGDKYVYGIYASFPFGGKKGE